MSDQSRGTAVGERQTKKTFLGVSVTPAALLLKLLPWFGPDGTAGENVVAEGN